MALTGHGGLSRPDQCPGGGGRGTTHEAQPGDVDLCWTPQLSWNSYCCGGACSSSPPLPLHDGVCAVKPAHLLDALHQSTAACTLVRFAAWIDPPPSFVPAAHVTCAFDFAELSLTTHSCPSQAQARQVRRVMINRAQPRVVQRRQQVRTPQPQVVRKVVAVPAPVPVKQKAPAPATPKIEVVEETAEELDGLIKSELAELNSEKPSNADLD